MFMFIDSENGLGMGYNFLLLLFSTRIKYSNRVVNQFISAANLKNDYLVYIVK